MYVKSREWKSLLLGQVSLMKEWLWTGSTVQEGLMKGFHIKWTLRMKLLETKGQLGEMHPQQKKGGFD